MLLCPCPTLWLVRNRKGRRHRCLPHTVPLPRQPARLRAGKGSCSAHCKYTDTRARARHTLIQMNKYGQPREGVPRPGQGRPRQAQLSTHRSRRLSCRLSLRRRCSRPRARRSSSSRALRGRRESTSAPVSTAARAPDPALPAQMSPHLHPLLLVQVPDQLITLVHQ